MSKDVIYVGTNVSPFDRIRDYYHGAEKIGGGKWYDTARCLGASEYKHISVLYFEYDI